MSVSKSASRSSGNPGVDFFGKSFDESVRDIQALRSLIKDLNKWLIDTEQEHLQTAKRIGGRGGRLWHTSARAYELTRMKLEELIDGLNST